MDPDFEQFGSRFVAQSGNCCTGLRWSALTSKGRCHTIGHLVRSRDAFIDAAYGSVLLASGRGEKSISPNWSDVDDNDFLAKSAYLFLLGLP
jgi:hypothetical protein